MKETSTSATVELLTSIWQRLLLRSSIGVDDNFFDLGGDSALALELFNEIARSCGRDLPPVVIYHAPTIATLAALMEEPATPGFPPIVQLKAGDPSYDCPPLFITHGLGGSVIDFYQVLKHLHTPHAIFGMQARGLDGVDAPFDRIEDMAAFYLEAVRDLQPHGPYFLVGYSLGGLVTFEMAQRLSAMGEEIALLAMLDSYPHSRYLSLPQRLRLKIQFARRRAAALAKGTLPDAINRLFHPEAQSTRLPGSSYQLPDLPLSPTMQSVRECAYKALERYQPRFYPGKVKFVRAALVTDFPADPIPVWAGLVQELTVDTIPGDHLGIMTSHFEDLAATLARYGAEAFPK